MGQWLNLKELSFAFCAASGAGKVVCCAISRAGEQAESVLRRAAMLVKGWRALNAPPGALAPVPRGRMYIRATR